MNGIEDVHVNNMSLHSSSRSKLTEFTFCNISDFNDNEKLDKDEHPFVSTPSFRPKISYNCSSPSTKTTRNNKILEILNNLPESCQELSLKDIVVDDLEKQRSVVDQKSVMKSSLKDRKLMTKSERTISRSVSLDTGVFMLKMFNPVSCGMKKSRSSSSNKSNSRFTPPNTKSRSAELAPGCWFITKPWKSTR